MRRRAFTLVLVILATAIAASGASAKRMHRHSVRTHAALVRYAAHSSSHAAGYHFRHAYRGQI